MNGLCECGCGQRTPLADRTDSRRGQVRGEPLRFVNGHNARMQTHPRSRVHLTRSGQVRSRPWTDDELLDEWVWVRNTCLRDDFPRRARVGIDRWHKLIARAGRDGDPRAELGRADRDRLDEAATRTRKGRAA